MAEKTEITSQLADNFLSPQWRLENLYRIADKNGQNVLFRPNAVQSDLQKRAGKRTIVLKARQQGVSTLFELIGLDEVLWNNNWWVCIIAHHQKTLDILFSKIQFAWDNLDPELRALVGEPKSDNKHELYWRERNSRIYVALEVLGGTNQRVHFSEYALISDDRISNTLPTVPPNGYVVKESTPFGTGNKFYRDYVAGKTGKSDEVSLCYQWWLSPEYQLPVRTVTEDNLLPIEQSLIDNYGLTLEQIEWRRREWQDQKQPDGSNLFPQVYIEDDISCFMASGDSVFDTATVQSRLSYLRKNKKVFVVGTLLHRNNNLKFVEADDGKLKVFEPPRRENEYCLGIDVSLGGPKSDDQVIKVLKRGGYNDIVATYVNRTEIGIFAQDAAHIGKFYNTAWICPERNSIGEAFIEHLIQLYPNEKIYCQQNRAQLGGMTRVQRFGYNTTRGRNIGKQRLITLIQDWLREDGLDPDEETLEQMLAYQRMDLISPSEGYKMGASAGNKDDRVIALGLAMEMDSVLPVFKVKLGLLKDAYEMETIKMRRRMSAQPIDWMSI